MHTETRTHINTFLRTQAQQARARARHRVHQHRQRQAQAQQAAHAHATRARFGKRDVRLQRFVARLNAETEGGAHAHPDPDPATSVEHRSDSNITHDVGTDSIYSPREASLASVSKRTTKQHPPPPPPPTPRPPTPNQYLFPEPTPPHSSAQTSSRGYRTPTQQSVLRASQTTPMTAKEARFRSPPFTPPFTPYHLSPGAPPASTPSMVHWFRDSIDGPVEVSDLDEAWAPGTMSFDSLDTPLNYSPSIDGLEQMPTPMPHSPLRSLPTKQNRHPQR